MTALPSEAFEYEAEDSWRSEEEMEQEYRMRFAPGRSPSHRGAARSASAYRGAPRFGVPSRTPSAYRATSRPLAPHPPAGGQRRPFPPYPPRRPRPRPHPYPYPYPVGGPWPVGVGVGPSSGAEYTRWLQASLNQVMNLQLSLDGVMSQQVRDAVRDFQRSRQLPADGFVGPDTERALVEARRGGQTPPPGGTEPAGDLSPGAPPPANGAAAQGAPANGQPGATEPPPANGAGAAPAAGQPPEGEFGWAGQAANRAWDWLTGPSRIIDRTHLTPKSKRVGKRDPKTVYALVLHQMAFSRGSNPTRYDTVTAHYAILPDGKILQLHPVDAYLNASNGFNARSVAVEFAGNLPSTRGKCWRPQTYGCHKVTPEQIEAGRYLVQHLIRQIGLTHILAHRQSSGTRENDPGPDIWYHVGQWAIDGLGLKDGGPGFKVGSGHPIPDEWRTWGRRTTGAASPTQGEWEWELGGSAPAGAAGAVAGAAAGASPLAALAPHIAANTQPTIRNALTIVKAISRYHGIPWRVAYTVLQHEGGVRLFSHHDGVMQTTRSARDATIPRIPGPLKLTLLGLRQTDTTSDANLTRAIHREFPRRLAVQIATGIQELKANLDRFNGYVALAYQAYNAGPGWAYYTVTQGKNKSRPAGVDATLWESMCRFGAALLHQMPNEVQIDMGVWQCDANIPTWSSHIPVRDRRSRLSLIAYKYLRSITERIHSQKPTTPCTSAVHGAQHRRAGTGPIVTRTTREGALDKLYDARKLGRYYAVASSELPAIAADNLPLKVLNGRLVKMPHASGNVTPRPA